MRDERRKFFDDRVYYCTKTDRIYIGRPDYKIDGKWRFHFFHDSSTRDIIGNAIFIPKSFVEIGREPEMSLFK